MQKLKRTLYLLIASIMFLNLFSTALAGWLTPLGFVVFILPVYGILATAILITLVKISYHHKSFLWFAVLSTMLCFIPLSEPYETVRFMVLRPTMERVATQMAEEINRNTPASSQIPLPKGYDYLSRGGYVYYGTTTKEIEILFVKFPGLIDGAVLYRYQTDVVANSIALYQNEFNPGYQRIERIAPKWFYMVTG